MPRAVEIEAPAKVNLFLRVGSPRPDGFHDLDTLFQALSLADRVVVSLGEPEPRGRRSGEGPGGDDASVSDDASDPSALLRAAPPPVHLAVDGPDLGPPAANLAYRAARLFLADSGCTAPVRIQLEKHVPAGAGLGGGSSDAAAVLKALAALTGFDDGAALHRMACALGSDVPFFLCGSPLARARGRGEVLTELPALPQAHLVLALPDVHVSTAEAFAELARQRADGVPGSGRGETRASPPDGRRLPKTAPSGWDEIDEAAWNDFESVVVPRHRDVQRSLEGLRREGASAVVLSGSGAASFGRFSSGAAAEEAARRLSDAYPWRFVAVTTRTTMPEPDETETGQSGAPALP